MTRTLVLLLLSTAFCSAVFELTKQNFDDVVVKQRGVFVVVFTQDQEPCDACTEIENLPEELDGQAVGFSVGTVDCGTEKSLCAVQGIKTLPAVMVYPAVPEQNPYKRNQPFKRPTQVNPKTTVEILAKEAKKLIPTKFITRLKESEDVGVLDAAAPAIVLLTKKRTSSNLYKALSTMHSEQGLNFFEVHSSHPAAAALGAAAFPHVLAIPEAGDRVPYEGDLEYAALDEFVKGHVPKKAASVGDAKEEAERKEEATFGPLEVTSTHEFNTMVLSDHRTWLVEFFSSSDPTYDEDYKAVWDAAAMRLKGKVPLAAVDCDVVPELAKKYAIRDCGEKSSIRIFPHDRKRTPLMYKQERTAKAIADEAVRHMQSYVVTVTTSTWDSFIEFRPEAYKMVLFTNKIEPSPMYKALSRDNRDNFIFALVHSSEKAIVDTFGQGKKLPIPSVFMIGPNPQNSAEATTMFYQGPMTQAGLQAFLNKFATEVQRHREAGTPDDNVRSTKPGRVEHMNSQADFERMCLGQIGLCVVTVFDRDTLPAGDDTRTVEAQKYFHTLGAAAAKLHRKPMSFLWITNEHADFLDYFHVDSGFPAVLVISPRKSRSAMYRGAFTSEGLVEFLEHLLQGKERTSKYDDIPPLLEEGAPPFEEPVGEMPDLSEVMEGGDSGDDDDDDDDDAELDAEANLQAAMNAMRGIH